MSSEVYIVTENGEATHPDVLHDIDEAIFVVSCSSNGCSLNAYPEGTVISPVGGEPTQPASRLLYEQV